MLKLNKRYGGFVDASLENGTLSCLKKIGQRDTLFFICSKCNKEAHRRISLFKTLVNLTDKDFHCELCSRKENFVEKYGVESPIQLKEIKEKIKNTNLQKYGTENPMQNKRIAKKAGETRRKKTYEYRKNYLNSEIITPFEDYDGTKKIYEFKCKKCKSGFTYNSQNPKRMPRCSKCFPTNLSIMENDLINFIEELGFSILKNTRNIIPPYELDVFIPEKNIAIELNGLYWHSETNLKKSNKDPKKYHLEKFNLCNEKKIFIIQIFEDEWIEKQEIVKSRLKHVLGKHTDIVIGGRKTLIKEIDYKTKKCFLENTHLQGDAVSKINLGAFHNDKLIGVMTFSNLRICVGEKTKKNEYELVRFSTDLNISSPGLANKMLKYFLKKNEAIKIFSYSDKRWSNGNLYKKLGFTYSKTTSPNYWYFKGGKRKHRFNYRKNRLIKILENFNPNITEYSNMLNNGFDRIWDCGNDKWELIL